MEPEALLQHLQPEWPATAFEKWKAELQSQIAFLITHDFERLLRLLYTVDVEERVLKHLLQQQPQPDAAALITDLLITRQLKKIETRAAFKPRTRPPDEEAW